MGKTTTAVTLAHGLAQKLEGRGHVLIVDLDPQGNVAHSLGLSLNGRDLATVLTGDVPVEQAICVPTVVKVADRLVPTSGSYLPAMR